MKSIFNLFVIIFLYFTVIACDPGKDIDFTNKTESKIKIKITVNSNGAFENLREVYGKDSIVLEVKPKETQSLNYGMGLWSEDEVNEIVNSIENIKIETPDNKNVHKSINSITEAVKDNRIRIVVENEK